MAAPIKLNTTTSIVDFLKSKGQPSDFPSREKMFKERGLESRLGTYTGSPTQNPAFLKVLQGEEKPVAVASSATPTSPETRVSPFLGNFSTKEFQTAQSILGGFGVEPKTGRVLPVSKGYFPAVGGSAPLPEEKKLPEDKTAVKVAQPKEPSVAVSPTPTPSPALAPPPTAVPEQAPSATEISGITDTTPSEADLINTVFSDPRFKIFLDRLELTAASEETKAQQVIDLLDRKFAVEKTEIEESLGRRGLFMSGMRASKVMALVSDLAGDKLNVAKGLALDLMERDLDLRQRIYEDISKLVESADKGKQQAIEQLNKAGFAVVGGRLMPTVEAIREERLQDTAELAQAREERLAAATEMQLERTNQLIQVTAAQLQLSQNKDERDALRLQLDIMKDFQKTQTDFREDAAEIIKQAQALEKANPDEAQRILMNGSVLLRTVYTPDEISNVQIESALGIKLSTGVGSEEINGESPLPGETRSIAPPASPESLTKKFFSVQ